MQTWFKMEALEYGWVTMRICKDWINGSDYLGYDLPKELLRKVWNVLQEDGKEEWLYLMDEPGAEIMQISHNDGKVHLAVYDLSKECFDLSSKEEDEKDNCGKCRFHYDFAPAEMVDGLVSEFYLYENGNGRALYETHWAKFPVDEYEKLKNLAFELDRKQSKFHKLYCVDTMYPERLEAPVSSK